MEYKEFKIESDGTFGYLKIKQKSSGTLPTDFKGSFTSHKSAKKAIDTYTSKKRSKKNDTTTSSTGDK